MKVIKTHILIYPLNIENYYHTIWKQIKKKLFIIFIQIFGGRNFFIDVENVAFKDYLRNVSWFEFIQIYMFPSFKKNLYVSWFKKKNLYVSLSIASISPKKKKKKSSAYNRWRVRVAVEAAYLPSPVAAVKF